MPPVFEAATWTRKMPGRRDGVEKKRGRREREPFMNNTKIQQRRAYVAARALTVDDLMGMVDESRLRQMFREFENFNDWERRLLEAKLRKMNRNGARYLPPLSLQAFGIEDEGSGSR
jgi:hypothetical protein